jgi:ABC-type sugar transport system substrate-binding protein
MLAHTWDSRADRVRQPIDAIYGLSDSMALISREIALELGKCSPDMPVVGINGDPSALARNEPRHQPSDWFGAGL